MPYDRFLIGPMNSGLQTDLKPFFIPEDAFSVLENAYVFRGRVRKRFGSLLTGGATAGPTAFLSSRVFVNLGNTDGSGNFSGTVPGTVFKIGQMFSVGNQMFTVYQTGTPGAMKVSGTTGATGTYNTTNGAVVINGAPTTTAVDFYPAEPIMGLTDFLSGSFNNQPSFAFDTQFAYQFGITGWARSTSGTAPVWQGTNSNFFWIANYLGAIVGQTVMWVTNFNYTAPNPAATDDYIWTYDSTNGWIQKTAAAASANGIYFLPTGLARYQGPYVKTAKIIIPFQNRLLLLYTVENNNPNHNGTAGTNSVYPQRCRYSALGSTIAQNSWYEPNTMDTSGTAGGLSIASGAGFIDAATDEQIQSAEFIKDRLIVFFERSTWEIAYTGNPGQPFIWQKINTELGSESQFSSIPFDIAILTMGTTGVHACNGANVERIDTKIPDQIFQINEASSGLQRVAGIRDYYTEMVYWSFPSTTLPVTDTGTSELYPNQVLVYNYRNNSWGINDDTFTAFGYFDQQPGLSWSTIKLAWEDADMIWGGGPIQPQFRQIIGGNQEGFILYIEADVARNAPAMQVTNITATIPPGNINLTIVDHTLSVGDFILLEMDDNPADTLTYSGITGLNNKIVKVLDLTNPNTVVAGPATFTGTYIGGATAARVSDLNIQSKQWNPYLNLGTNLYLAKIDFLVDATTSGQVTVDYFPSYTELSILYEAMQTNTIMGNGVLETSPYTLYPLESQQLRLWHPVYFQTTGEAVQIRIYMSDSQMLNPAISLEDFQMHALVLHTSVSASRLQ